MTIQTNFNVSPYYDDYSDSKDFLRVLFRPGLAVQARELTQLQTILQKQTGRLGAHLFQDGSRVYGGDIVLDTNVKALRLETKFGGDVINVYNFADKTILDTSTGARARVVEVTNQTVYDPITLYIQPESEIDFPDGHTIQTTDGVFRANTVSLTGVSGIQNALTDSSIVSISNGVFYISGFMVNVDRQLLILDKYANNPTYSVGLAISENLLSSIDDSSLLDNAQGAFNYAAPGANRFQIKLTLAKKTLTGTSYTEQYSEEKFIELLRVKEGKKLSDIKYPIYSELETTLARRTFDESGDYTVTPFKIQLLPDFGGNSSVFTVGLEAGKAYVKGYEYETISTTYLQIDKSRTSEELSNYNISSDYGNKLYLSNMVGTFDTSRHELVDIHCVSSQNVNTISLAVYNSTKIGTARVRSLDYETADINSSNTTHFHSKYSVHLYDIRSSNKIYGEVNSGSDNRTVNLPTLLTSNTPGAYTGALLTVNTVFGANVSSDTVTVSEYITVGNSHVAVCNTFLTQNVRSNSTFTISFNLNIAESLTIIHRDSTQTQAANDTHLVKTTYADIDNLSKYNQDPAGNVFVTDTNRNSLLFKLPYSPIKTLPNGITYAFKRVERISSDANGVFDFTCDADGVFLPVNGTLSTSQIKENFIVTVFSASGVVDANGRFLTSGQHINFDTGTGRSVTVNDDRVEINTNTTGSYVAEIIYTVQVTGSIPRQKTLVAANTTFLSGQSNTVYGQVRFDSPNKLPGGKDNLMISDIYNLVAVVDSLNADADVSLEQMQAALDNPNLSTNITNHYILDTGQRDNFYDHGGLVLKGGYPAPTGRILALVDYFTHTGGGYFSVDSYPTDISYNNNEDVFTYSTIPKYVSPLSGELIELRDVVDFRPVRTNANNAKGSNTINDIITNTGAFSNLQLGSTGSTPDTEYSLNIDIEYYLSRIDKVVLTRDKEFKVLPGVPALDPVTPVDDDKAMTLYTLSIPAYTFDISDIGVRYIDNKRYTMRDIGKLERRIEKLEYYTTLSLLEKETATKDITSTSSVDSLFNPQGARFKNGILVDSFIGHSIGDIENRDYSVSIDLSNREMRPSFVTDNFNFTYSDDLSIHTSLASDIVTLPYTSSAVVTQSLYSDSVIVNPYSYADYLGYITLYPSSDTWFDTTSRPSVIVNSDGQNDNWRYSIPRAGHGTQWNDWSKIWSGLPVNPDMNITLATRNLISTRSTNLISQKFTRTGIKTENIPEAIVSIIGNKVVDLSVIPFMREQAIYFVAKDLKPYTNVYCHFDNTTIIANTTPAITIVVSDIVDNTLSFLEGEIIRQGANVAMVLTTDLTSETSDATIQIRVLSASQDVASSFATGLITSDQSGIQGTISTKVTPSQGTLLRTNAYGEIAGYFTIPSATYRTGHKLFRITDANTTTLSGITTLAETTYSSVGLLDGSNAYVDSTRFNMSRRESVTSSRIVNDVTVRESFDTSYINPLAQSFFVDKHEFPNGMFIESIDLCVKAKPAVSNLPLKIQIRPIINGFPSGSEIIPLTEVSLAPEYVKVSVLPDLGSTTDITKFKFRAPVYLKPGEYAITVLTNSKDYELHAGVIGDFVTNTTRRISKQPNVGSFYNIQNAAQWGILPNYSIMFSVNQCVFDISTTGQAVLISKGISNLQQTSDVDYDRFKITTSVLDFYSTSVSYSYYDTDTNNNLATSASDIIPEQNISLSARKRMIYDSNGCFRLYTTLSSSDINLSPVLDLERFSIVTVENVINNGGLSANDFYIVDGGANYNSSVVATITGGNTSNAAAIDLTVTDGAITGITLLESGSGYISSPTVTLSGSAGNGAIIRVNGETDSEGGNLTAKYISRKVTLEDGFDASDVKVLLTAYKPKTSDIVVYVKVIEADDPDNFDEKNYIKLVQETPSTIYSLNDTDYKEYTFKTSEDTASYVTNGVVHSTFKTFAVKICLLSSTTLDVPRVTDMRVIALDA